MPPPFVWKELDDGRSIVIDKRGDNPTRAWYIAGAGVDAARADTNPVKPERGKPHPNYPDLVVDGVAYRRMLTGTRCEARYVPKGMLYLPGESGDADDFFQISPYFETATRNLPVIEQVRKSFRDSSTPDQLVWKYVDTAPFEYDKLVFTIEVNAEILSTPHVDTMLNTMLALRSELGKIHTIGDIDYQFSVEDAERLSIDRYKFVYKWTNDPGIPNTLATTDIVGSNWARIGTYAYGFTDDDYIIPPFSRFDTGPARDANGFPDPTLPPVVVISPIALTSPGGHLRLPGIA